MRKLKNRVNNFLELPDEIVSKIPKLTTLGFNELLIENYKSILEYQDFFIRVNTHIGIININGFELTMNEMTVDDIMINGKIESIDFERIIEE